jgi:hypothetical protein
VGRYLDLLSHDEGDTQIRDCEKSELSEESPPARPLNSLSSLFSHPDTLAADHLGAPAMAAPWSEVEEERAAIIQHDGAIPRAWAEGFARLDPDRPPGDVPPKRWQLFVDDVGRFLDGPFCAVAGDPTTCLAVTATARSPASIKPGCSGF